MRTIVRPATAIIWSAGLAIGGVCAQTLYEKGKKDEVTFVPGDDPAMAAAFRRARSSLDQFFALAKQRPPHTDLFSVKIGISDGKDTEYFWIGDFHVEGDNLTGRVDNAPRVVRKVKFGERIRFKRSDIVDWTYLDIVKPRMYGNFTLCAMLTKESQAERDRHRREYGLQCDG